MGGTRVLVAHGGGPTPVINASLAGVLAAGRESGAVERIYAAAYGVEGLMAGAVVDLTDLGASEIERLRDTPSSAIGSCRHKVSEADHERILRSLDELGVDVLFYTGGNDSMDTCAKLSSLSRSVQVIGIPKTIDNDLALTDHAPGYGSAARFAAIAAREIGLDVRALPIHVAVVEFMGRNAGWITAASLLGRTGPGTAPHLVYLPEEPFSEERFLDEVTDATARHGGIVVAVSEGLVDPEGRSLVTPKHGSDIDAFGHALPGDVSHYLSRLITRRTGQRSRSEKPGLMGRASLSVVSQTDRAETFELGRSAMRAALDGATGVMVGFERETSAAGTVTMRVKQFPLEPVANVERTFPREWMGKSTGLDPAFDRYVRPLVGGPLPEAFRLDLPAYPAVRDAVRNQ